MSLFSAIYAIFGCSMFALGLCGLSICCYELMHHEDLKAYLNTAERRQGAMAAVGVVFLATLYNNMPGGGPSFHLGNMNPSRLIGNGISDLESSCSNCYHSLEGIGSKLGGLCSSCFGSSRIGSYLPNMPGMPNINMPNAPSMPNINMPSLPYMPSIGGWNSYFGSSVISSGLPMLALLGVLIYGGALRLQCNGSVSCA